jgi:beta-lactam-binding protein with PASTA domain
VKFRRRRGLGRSSRLRGETGEETAGDPLSPGTEEPAAGTPGSERAGPEPGSGPVPRRGRRPRGLAWLGPSRRRVLVPGLLLVALFGLGYLAAARWLFPAGPGDQAGEVALVPDLVGLGSEEATRSLTEAGLTLQVVSRVPHPKAPDGAIIAQTPLPGQFARPGAPIQVTLSSGPQRRRIPDLRGLSARQGQIVLQRLGFETVTDSARSNAQRGQVVGSRPEAGDELELPAQVTILVSRGPAVSRVPDLSGRHVEDVPAVLRDAGLTLGDVTYDDEAFAAAGRVIAQSPPPGFALRRGGSVSIRVAGPPPRGGADSASGPVDGGQPGRS